MGHPQPACPKQRGGTNSVVGVGKGNQSTEPEQAQQSCQTPKLAGGVEFGGFAITHIEKPCYAASADDEDRETPPPSLAESNSTDPPRMEDVKDDDDDEDGEDEGNDQESIDAIAKLYSSVQEDKTKRQRKR